MTLLLRIVELFSRVYASTLTAFSEIFLAVNQREISPAPVIPGSSDHDINPYTNAAGIPGAYSTLTPSTMKKRLLFLGTFMSVLFLSFAFSTTALGQATVTSDKGDYPPRSNAVFTGAGFAPGETVQLKVKNLFRACNTVSADSSYLPWTVVADAVGGFVTNWTVCDCPGDSLRLKATGLTSGLIAYAYFTD